MTLMSYFTFSQYRQLPLIAPLPQPTPLIGPSTCKQNIHPFISPHPHPPEGRPYADREVTGTRGAGDARPRPPHSPGADPGMLGGMGTPGTPVSTAHPTQGANGAGRVGGEAGTPGTSFTRPPPRGPPQLWSGMRGRASQGPSPPINRGGP